MEIRLIEEVILEQKEEFIQNLNNDFCPRREEQLVDLDSKLAQVVLGIRRCGKSTLCFNVIKNSDKKFAYINFDDERFADLENNDFNKILESLFKIYGNFSNLFIDEIQNINSWHLFANRLLRQNIKLLITGSNAKLLSGELATHLTGRYMKIELYPFSFSEYCLYGNIDTSHETTKQRAFLRVKFDEYISDGGMPELLEEKRKQTYINTLFNNILENDIEKRYQIRYKSSFEKMASHLMNNVPMVLNYEKLRMTFNFKSSHTPENYVSYLKNVYLISGLQKYSFKSKVRVTNEKIYPIDIAFMNNRENAFMGDNLGWRLESIVYIELNRRYKPLEYDIYYLNETSYECDFVVVKGNAAKQIIQVCYDLSNEKTLKREINSILKAAEKTSCDNLLIITDTENRDIEADGKLIRIRPAYSWILSQSTWETL